MSHIVHQEARTVTYLEVVLRLQYGTTTVIKVTGLEQLSEQQAAEIARAIDADHCWKGYVGGIRGATWRILSD